MQYSYLAVALLFSLLSVQSLTSLGVFHTGSLARKDESNAGTVCLAFLISMFLTGTVLYLTKTGENYSRAWLVLSSLIAPALVISSRQILRALKTGDFARQQIALIIDSNQNSLANHIETSLEHDREDIVEFDLKTLAIEEIIGEIESRRNHPSRSSYISEVWVTSSVLETHSWPELEAKFTDSSVRLAFIPDLPSEINLIDKNIAPTGRAVLIYGDLGETRQTEIILKSIFDTFIALALLVVIAPMLLLIAFIIKLEDGGPVLFHQKRYGLNGKEFRITKFRSMSVGSTTQDFKQAVKNDRRVTKIGYWLRKTSLDEVPQLLNVVKQEMSLVGPRPHPNRLNEEFRTRVQNYMRRHLVKPGITGLAQVNGLRGETRDSQSMAARIEMDLEYIRTWNLFLDIRILLRTIKLFFFDRNAY